MLLAWRDLMHEPSQTPRMRPITKVWIAVTLVWCLAGIVAWRLWQLSTDPLRQPQPRHAASFVEPRPEIAPEEVVRLQLTALQSDSAPSHDGIRQCFRFASPANREVTGPLSRFAAMVRTPPYDIMLRATTILVGRPQIENEHAVVLATVADRGENIRLFRFLLTRQRGEVDTNCWMTEAVIEVRRPAEPPDPGESIPSVEA